MAMTIQELREKRAKAWDTAQRVYKINFTVNQYGKSHAENRRHTNR